MCNISVLFDNMLNKIKSKSNQDSGQDKTCSKLQNLCLKESLFKLITEMFYRFRFSDCFRKRIPKDRAISSNSMVEKKISCY